LNRATVLAVLGRSDQFARDQRLDEVASCGLMHVHGSRQIVDSYAGPGADDAQRPQLRAPYAGLLFDLLKVSLDGIEDKTKPAQHPGSGLADLTSRRVASCGIGTSNCRLAFGHRRNDMRGAMIVEISRPAIPAADSGLPDTGPARVVVPQRKGAPGRGSKGDSPPVVVFGDGSLSIFAAMHLCPQAEAAIREFHRSPLSDALHITGLRAIGAGLYIARLLSTLGTCRRLLEWSSAMRKRIAWLVTMPTLALALTSHSAWAIVRGQSDTGIEYVSGGIGQSELRALHAERARYTLWVATVSKGSGAYLSDVELRITNLDTNRVVLLQTLDGPWLFAALPPGHYAISATARAEGSDAAETITTRVQVRPGDHRQAVLRFSTPAEVGPEREHPFGGNPFAEPVPAR